MSVVYMASLTPAATVSGTDTTFWCTNPAGGTAGVNLNNVTAAQIAAYVRGTLSSNLVTVAQGGTGASSAPAALTNLGAVPLAGGTMTGALALSAGSTAPTPATADISIALATTAFVKAQGYAGGGPFVALAGGTMTGPLILSADPAAALGAATKQYVDGHTLILTGDTTGSGTGSTIATTTVQLQGRPVATTAPLANQVLQWTGSQWSPMSLAAGGNVTAGTLTPNQLVIATGATSVASLGSFGTATTVLHGVPGGAPTWAAVSLTADVSGTLPLANGGTNATTAAAALTNLGGLPLTGGTVTGNVTITSPNILTVSGRAALMQVDFGPSTASRVGYFDGASGNFQANGVALIGTTSGTSNPLTLVTAATADCRVVLQGNRTYSTGCRADGLWIVSDNTASTDRLWIDTAGALTLNSTNAYKPGGGAWVAPSDRALKSTVEEWPTGLAAVLALNPISYRYSDDGWNHAEVDHIGLDAENAAAVIPEMARSIKVALGDDPKNTIAAAIDHTPLTFALVNAVKELAKRLETLEHAVH